MPFHIDGSESQILKDITRSLKNPNSLASQKWITPSLCHVHSQGGALAYPQYTKDSASSLSATSSFPSCQPRLT
jgi:hypothetical protein